MKLSQHPKSQRGQAITEFVAAMALFIPLVLGVIYIGKYTDMKHQAIQASRYAAMQRAMDPHFQQNDGGIGNDTVARFFRDGGRHNIGADDRATGATAGDLNPGWYQVDGKPMLNQYSDVTVALAPKNIRNFAVTGLNSATGFKKLESTFGVGARVEVPVANIQHFDALNGLNVKISATTVIAGDPWNGGGTKDVGSRFTLQNVPGEAADILNRVPGLNALFDILAGTPAPQFGCEKPDVVPARVAPGAQYNPEDNPINPSNPVNKCY